MKVNTAGISLASVPVVIGAIVPSPAYDEHGTGPFRCDARNQCHLANGPDTLEPAPALKTIYHADQEKRATCSFGHLIQQFPTIPLDIGLTSGSCDSWLQDCKELQDELDDLEGYWEISEWPADNEWAAFDPLPELKSKCPIHLRTRTPEPMRIGDKDIAYGLEMVALACMGLDPGSLSASATCIKHSNETDSSDSKGVRFQVKIGGLDN